LKINVNCALKTLFLSVYVRGKCQWKSWKTRWLRTRDENLWGIK